MPADDAVPLEIVFFNKDSKLIFVQKACCLDASHQIIRVDTGDKTIFPLDGDDGNPKGGEVRGRESVAQDNQPLNVVGQKLPDVIRRALFPPEQTFLEY